VIITEEEYEQLCEKMRTDEEADGESSGDDQELKLDKERSGTKADGQKRQYGSSAEGEHHYAAVEEED
jgi:hypothetical protein